jgi:DNA-binding winged helix-turn-helix (wHTH) protein
MDVRGAYQVGKHVIDLDRRRISSNGSTIELGWKHFEALRLLVEANGRVVEREEFFRQIWQGQIVDESNLTKCITQLRKVLNNGGEEDYLETVPRLGYRLVAPVRREPDPASDIETTADRPRRRGWIRWVAAAVVAILAGGLMWSILADRKRLSRAEAAYEEAQRLRWQKTPGNLSLAVEGFHRAIQLNPNKAIYHASLAEVLTKLPGQEGLDQKLILETAQRGILLDARCAGCNAVLGFVLFSKFWDWARADQHLSVAVELDPRDEGSRGYYAMLLATQGRLDEALRQVDDGIRLDRYHSTLYTIKSGILYFMKRYAEAETVALRALSFGQDQKSAWDWLAYSDLLAGRPHQAIESIARSGMPWYSADAVTVFRVNGLTGVALNVTQALQDPVRAYRRAHWSMVLGDRVAALDDLETAHRVRTFDVIYLAVDPMFEPLRSEPRFRKIIEQMRLTPPR